MVTRPTVHVPYPATIQTSIDWKTTLPSYLSWLFSIHLNQSNIFTLSLILLFTFILFLGLYAYLLYLRFKKQLSQESVILEIKPPAISLQSAFSTRQLFTILHSFDHKLTYFEKLLKVKRRISFEIVSTREDGIRYLLYLPKEDVDIVAKNIRAYVPEVVIKEIPDYIPQTLINLKAKPYSIKELKFKHPYELPLQEQDVLTQYDPIAYITGHMTKLEPDEMISLQVVTTPVTPATHEKLVEHIYKLNKRIENGQEIESEFNRCPFLDVFAIVASLLSLLGRIGYQTGTALGNWVMDFTLATRRPAYQYPQVLRVKDELSKHVAKELTPHQRETNELVKKKINQELFETTIRLFITSSSQKTIADRQTGIIASLSTFKNPGFQELKVKNQLPISLGFLRELDYLKLKHRLLAFSLNPILSISEISSLYHFPYTKTTQTEDLQLLRSYQLPAPIDFKKAETNFDVVFAHNIHGESIIPIGLTLEVRRRHIYVVGATGTGKSTMLLHMIYQDMLNDKGLAVFDPHGDLAKRILEVIPKERSQDVVYFNPYDILHVPAINLLELPEGLSEVESQREKDLIVSGIISAFHKLYPEKYMGPRMEHVLRNFILTALELENPTFRTIYKLLTNSKFRAVAKTKLKDEILIDFWKEEFEKLTVSQKEDLISPITNKLGRFLTTTLTRKVIDQAKSTLDFEDIINGKKILICNLAKGKIGEDVSSFLGILMITKLQQAALRRVHIPEEERVDFFLYIDEFQNFATQSFAQILSEARKYRLDTILVHQNLAQIKDASLIDTIIGNCGTMIVYRNPNPRDEDILFPIFAPQVLKGQILNLPSFTFYIKINAIEPQETFTGYVEKFTVKGDEAIEREVIAYSQKTYGSIPAIEALPKKESEPKVNNGENDEKNKGKKRPSV